MTLGELSQLLESQFPSVAYRFDDENTIYTKPVEVSTAKTVYGWTDIIDLKDGISELSASVRSDEVKKDIEARKFPLENVYKWLELILGAVAMQFLSNITGTFIQFKYVDFRLLFVIIMGSVWGLRFGVYAFILASLSVILNWYQLGLEWELLTQNIGNWIPFVIYFSGGAISGVMRDRKETEITAEKEQTQLIYNKYEFLFEVFNEIRNLKDEYREQLVGYRDSFGKIFTVTRELDSLQEDEIFLSAISVFQNIMENNSVAIYSVSNNKFCRLETCSPEFYNMVSASLILTDYPELLDTVKEGRVFQNKEILDKFPAYASPIMSGSDVVALVMIWQADFEQMSMYYMNLFRILSGLTQDSLVRALKFLDINSEQIYIDSTKILQPKPFREVIEVKAQMQRNQIADYQVIKIDVEGSDIRMEELYKRIEEQIRDTDTIGMLEDGKFYVLLAQAREATVVDISKRLVKYGIQSEIIDKDTILKSN
jgi:UDP-glucose 4-epimerase